MARLVNILVLLCGFCSIRVESIAQEVQSRILAKSNQTLGWTFSLAEGDVGDDDDEENRTVVTCVTGHRTNETGWASLYVASSSEFPDPWQAYWAGFLETHQTRELTEAQFNNTMKWLCPTQTDCRTLYNWLEINMNHTLTESMKNKEDPFWYQVYLIMWQSKGMIDAYDGKFMLTNCSLADDYLWELGKQYNHPIFWLNLATDLPDLLEAIYGKSDCRTKQLRSNVPTCSALIKVLPSNADIYFGHNTWSGYQSMLRLAKLYDFPWRVHATSGQIVPGRRISFSSYPSVWVSSDDFHVIDSGLVTMETTIGVFNDTLFSLVAQSADKCVFEVTRVMVANRLGSDVYSWNRAFSQENSGTYNNQWMVLDYSKFTPGQELPDKDLFLISEQIPGLIHSEDMSSRLKAAGYYASYNVAYFPKIRELTGANDMEIKRGEQFSYEKCVRGSIYNRDQSKVKDLATMFQIQRYNDFTKDEFSRTVNCTPPYLGQFATAARQDLNLLYGVYKPASRGFKVYGAIDAKFTSSHMAKTLSFIGVSGPTYEQVPIFQWTKIPKPIPLPSMLPDRWFFPPYFFLPGNSANKTILMRAMPELSLKKDELLAEMAKL